MRTVILDPTGNPYFPEAVPIGTMLPVASYITKTTGGEVVHVLQLDPTREPQQCWNQAALFG